MNFLKKILAYLKSLFASTPAPSPVPSPSPSPNPAPAGGKDLPAGVTWADKGNGLVSIAALEPLFPGRTYAVKEALGYLDNPSAAYFGVLQNVQNATFAYKNSMVYTEYFTAAPNSSTGGYALTKTVVPSAYSCNEVQVPTFAAATTYFTDWYNKMAANPANKPGGSGFSVPGKK